MVSKSYESNIPIGLISSRQGWMARMLRDDHFVDISGPLWTIAVNQFQFPALIPLIHAPIVPSTIPATAGA
jgi:hypothetical protein